MKFFCIALKIELQSFFVLGNPMNPPTRLKFIRMLKGTTQRQLSAVTGISSPTLSLIETGKKSPHLEEIFKISLALGVAPNEFVEASQE